VALVIPPVPSRPPMNGTLYEDSPAAWRRDEQIGVWLQSSRPLTQPKLQVAGVDAAIAQSSTCTGACTGSCVCFAVDLSKPALPALRGTFALDATGIDSDGATLTAHGQLEVTRIAWRRSLGAQVRTTPAIGADGTIYVGTITGAGKSGSVVAVSAAGQQRWSKLVGRIDAAIAIGGGRLFVGAETSSTSSLIALDAAGAQVAQCSLDKDADLQAAPALIPDGVVFFASEKRELIAFRPGLSSACEGAQVGGDDIAFPDGLVTSGASAFFVDDRPSVHRYDLGSSWQPYNQQQWPGTPFSGYRNHGLAFTGDGKLVGAGAMMAGGTVFQASSSGPFKFDFGFFPPRVAASASGPVVTADGVVLVGVPTGIVAVSATATNGAAGDAVSTTPVLGEGGRLFALGDTGSVSEWSYAAGKPARTWSAPIESAGQGFDASPALDCARDGSGAPITGRPGMLYAVSRAGALTAVIVDSRGIDVHAPWPKHQRDPRNSSSADTQLQEFACP
jgi:hypothetical protein